MSFFGGLGELLSGSADGYDDYDQEQVALEGTYQPVPGQHGEPSLQNELAEQLAAAKVKHQGVFAALRARGKPAKQRNRTVAALLLSFAMRCSCVA